MRGVLIAMTVSAVMQRDFPGFTRSLNGLAAKEADAGRAGGVDGRTAA